MPPTKKKYWIKSHVWEIFSEYSFICFINTNKRYSLNKVRIANEKYNNKHAFIIARSSTEISDL